MQYFKGFSDQLLACARCQKVLSNPSLFHGKFWLFTECFGLQLTNRQKQYRILLTNEDFLIESDGGTGPVKSGNLH